MTGKKAGCTQIAYWLPEYSKKKSKWAQSHANQSHGIMMSQKSQLHECLSDNSMQAEYTTQRSMRGGEEGAPVTRPVGVLDPALPKGAAVLNH